MGVVIRKIKERMARGVLVAAAALMYVLSLPSEAMAYNYYDGTSTSLTTYGQTENDSTLDSGAQEVPRNYTVSILVLRGTNRRGTATISSSYVTSYGQSTSSWKYRKT